MPNEALKILEELNTVQQTGVSAVENQKKRFHDQRQMAAENADPKAKFGTAEALITGAASGFVFGGPIGAMLGIGVGLLSKKEQQGIIDQSIEKRKILSETGNIFGSTLDDLAFQVESPEDKALVKDMRKRYNLAMGYAESPSTLANQQAAQMFADLDKDMESMFLNNEAQRIQQEAFEKQLKEDHDARQVDTFIDLRKDYLDRSADFDSVMTSTAVAMNLLDDDDPAKLHGALFNVQKSLDPGLVNEGDVRALAGLGTRVDRLAKWLDNNASGNTVSPTDRAFLTGLMQEIRDERIKIQRYDDIQAKTTARLIDLDDDFVDFFSKGSNVPPVGNKELEVKKDLRAQAANDIKDAIINASESNILSDMFNEAKNVISKSLQSRSEKQLENQLKQDEERRAIVEGAR